MPGVNANVLRLTVRPSTIDSDRMSLGLRGNLTYHGVRAALTGSFSVMEDVVVISEPRYQELLETEARMRGLEH